MTQAQKIAKDKFKKAIAYRTKTGVSLKEAFAHIYGKKVGAVKKKVAPKKKAATKKKAAPKKKIASKKVGAIKIIEKGETKSAKAKATYQQVRTKKGTFKGLKKVGATSYYGSGEKVYPVKLKIGQKYEWIEGAEYLELKYIGLSKNNPRKKFGTKFGDGEYLFQWDDGKYIALSYRTILQSLRTIPKKVGAIKKKAAPKKSASKRITDIHKDSKSHNVNIRVVSGLPSYKDPDMARELELYADNDSLLYFQRRKPILINLSKKYKKGTYDVQKAAKLWRYYIDAALEKYNKEFGSRGDKWYDLMSVPDRNLLALEYAQNTKEEFDLGNFTEK